MEVDQTSPPDLMRYTCTEMQIKVPDYTAVIVEIPIFAGKF